MASNIVLVTGASSGIGEAIARRYGARGAHVLLLARNAGRLDTVAAAIRKDGGTASAYPVDLAHAGAVEELAARIASDIGTPDTVVNNAGAGRWLPLAETTPEAARAMIEVPYLASFYVTRAFLPGMMARGSGSLAYITSPAAYLAWPRASAYIAARRAVAGLAEALQSELKGKGISVTLVVLGTVDTPYWEHNPGSRRNVPKTSELLLPTLTAEQAAQAIVDGAARKRTFVVRPGLYRALFVLNALFPRLIAHQLRRASRTTASFVSLL